MKNLILFLINSYILYHKRVIQDIDKKLKFLNFLKRVDKNIENPFNLNKQELRIKKQIFEYNLKKLVNKKSELSAFK